MEGDISVEEVLRWTEQFAALGVHGVTLCDTTGMAYPSQVKALCERVRRAFPALELTLHFHNTRGMALANAYAALTLGVTLFDASVGGLGGCPFARHRGAAGNICAEDLVSMCHEMGIETGIDLEALIASSHIAQEIVGHPLPGKIAPK